MRIDWASGGAASRTCPACGDGGAKPRVLSAVHPRGGEHRLLRCRACGTAFYEELAEAPAPPPPAHAAGHVSGALKFYVEQGAGVDVILDNLFCTPPAAVRRYLEVGCGFGYALDFGRFAFGWECEGVDPSPLAAAGRDLLGLRITLGHLGEDGPSGEFDLVLGSEVLEHVADPHRFLRLVAAQTGPRGTLALTTPNAAGIHPRTPAGLLVPILSPGSHLVLFTPRSLAAALRAAGFAHVRVWPNRYTLRAVASRVPIGRRRRPRLDRATYRRYLEERAAAISPETPLGAGFAYRLLKEHLRRRDFDEAVAVLDRLAEGYRSRYGRDFTDPHAAANAPAPAEFEAFAAARPFHLAGVLLSRGLIEQWHRGDPERAAACFRASAQAGVTTRAALRNIGSEDGETEQVVWIARAHEVPSLGRRDVAQARRALAALRSAPEEADGPADLWPVPPRWALTARLALAAAMGNEWLRRASAPVLLHAHGAVGTALVAARVVALRVGARASYLRALARPRRPHVRERRPGRMPLEGARRVALFHHFDPRGRVRQYVLHHLRSLGEAGHAVVFCSNAPALEPEALERLAPLCALVVRRENLGRDFAAFRDALGLLPPLDRLESLLLTNDSVYGPLRDLGPVLRRMTPETADVWGLTESRYVRHHLQSYFVLFHNRALTHPAFRRFWDGVRPVQSKTWVVEQYEMGLTRLLSAAGLRCRALVPYDALAAAALAAWRERMPGAAAPARRYWWHATRCVERGVPLNPTHAFWEELLATDACYIKRDLLRENPTGVPGVDAWPRLLRAASDYDARLILDDLAAAAPPRHLASAAAAGAAAAEQ